MDSERTVNGYHAVNKSEYEAFIRDSQKIDTIKKKLDMKDFRQVEKVYSSICTGSIRFESKIGFDFEDEITSLYERLRKKHAPSNNRKPENRNTDNELNDDLPLRRSSKRSKNIEEDEMYDEKTAEFINRDRIFTRKVDNLDENVDKELVEYYIEKRRKNKNLIKFTIIASSIAILTGSLVMIILKVKSDVSSDNVRQEIEQSVRDNAFVFTTIKPEINNRITYDTYEIPPILSDYQELHEKNPDLIGWIKIDDTNIDYPVMQSSDNEYYLSHNFNNKNDANGCIFADFNCSIFPRSKNVILYGHHMKSGKMFANLEKYDSHDFFINHKRFTFNTIYEYAEYEVVFVFRDYVHTSDDTEFKYYEFVNVNSEVEFDSYMEELRNKSIYNTDVSISMDDELLTLSTCDYMQANGRFVVMAKKIK
ncbi:MAG: class B sortase [Lachnospiraceae bacterium]|nr:class B sortase [Lachnospiraceae bacterium]